MSFEFHRTGSSISSVYSRALPSYTAVLDLFELLEEEEQKTVLIQHLVAGERFELQLEVPEVVADKVQHLYFSAKNHSIQKGIQTLGIGYPLLSFFKNAQLIVAPLYIWRFSFEPLFNAPGQWKISIDASKPVKINPFLINHWQNSFKWSLNKIRVDFLPKDTRTDFKIDRLLRDLKEKITHLDNIEPQAIKAAPQIEELDADTKAASVYWSAVIANFQPYYKFLPVKINALKRTTSRDLELPLAYEKTEPLAQSLADHFSEHNLSVGAGKFEHCLGLIRYWLLHAMSTGKTLLITAHNYQLLQRLYQALSDLKLDQLIFLMGSVYTDWPIMQRKINAELPAAVESKIFSNRKFESVKGSLKKEETLLRQHYRAIREPVFQKNNFTEAVGLFLHYQNRAGKELLGSQLIASEFNFTDFEYEEVSRYLDKSQALFSQIKTLNHPLEILDDANFDFPDHESALSRIQQKISIVEKRLSRLHHEYIVIVNTYTDELHEHYEKYYQSLRRKLTTIIGEKAFYSAEYGRDFQLTATTSLRLLSNFGNRFKEMLTAKDELIKKHQALIQEFNARPYFDFVFEQAKEKRNIQKWDQDLMDFEKSLESWYENIDQQCQQEVKRLSPSNLHPAIDKKDRVQQAEQQLNEQLNYLNKQNILKENFKNVMLTTLKQQQFLVEVIEKLEQTAIFLKDFEAYFNWRNHWIHLSQATRKVVKALTKVKPASWSDAYNSWFLFNKLKLYPAEYLPCQAINCDKYLEQAQTFRELLPFHIQRLWKIRREKVQKEWKASAKTAHTNLMRLDGTVDYPPEQLYNWLKESLPYVVRQLPCILATPASILEWPENKAEIFDHTLFLDADQFDLHEAQPALWRSHKALLLGDHQRLALNTSKDPLWPYLETATVKYLPGPKEEETAAPLAIARTVNGYFDQASGQNKEEADATMQLLNQIEETPSRTFPKVGIITATSGQRDLLYRYFLSVKQQLQPGAERLQQLERNGLKVLHLEEVIYADFDILILNLTVALSENEENINDQIGFLLQPKISRQLSYLFSLNFQKLYLIHSLSTLEDSKLRSFLQNIPPLEAVLFQSKLPDKSWEFASKENTEIFMSRKLYFANELQRIMKPLLPKFRLQIYQFNKNLTPILRGFYANEQKPAFGILVDGFFALTDSTNFEWEFEQQKELQKKCKKIINIWSVDWLKNHKLAAQQLTETILGTFEK